jgi:hypothetical protein
MIRSLLLIGMTLSAVTFADEMNQPDKIIRRGKDLPQTFVIKLDRNRKNKNRIEVAHVAVALKPGEKPTDLVFSKMGISDEQVGIANASADDMETSGGTPSYRAAFARGGGGGGRGFVGGGGRGFVGGGGGRGFVGGGGRWAGGGVVGGGIRRGYGRGYINGAVNGAYGSRLGYGYGGGVYDQGYGYDQGGYDQGYVDQGYGYANEGYYGGDAYVNNNYPNGYYDASLFPGGNVDTSFWATSSLGGCGVWGGCASWRPFYQYYGNNYPYQPYWGYRTATSYIIYCQPGGWWG